MNIKLVASDCDGVLTDGGMYYTENGDIMKKFNVLDGMGFHMLKEKGIKTAIITGENNPLLQTRSEKLKVDYLITDTKDKLGALKKLCEEIKITIEEAAYIGDDIFDIPAIKECGFGCAPNSAFMNIKKHADYVTQRNGGEGAFREVAEIIVQQNE